MTNNYKEVTDSPTLLSVRTNPALWEAVLSIWATRPELEGRISQTLTLAVHKLSITDRDSAARTIRPYLAAPTLEPVEELAGDISETNWD